MRILQISRKHICNNVEFLRMIKILLKKLDKLYKDNEKKRIKNKLTEVDCEKKRKLVEKINSYIGMLNQFSFQMESELDEIGTDRILKEDNTLNDSWLHTMGSAVSV